MAQMMDNSDVEFLISQYLDRQLGPRERAEFEQRLEADAGLAEELRRYQALDAELAQFGDDELRAVDFASQRTSVMEALERQVLLAGSRRPMLILRPTFWVPVAAAAVVLLAVFIGGRFLGNGPVGPVGPINDGTGDGGLNFVASIVPPPAVPQGAGVVEVTPVQMSEGVPPPVGRSVLFDTPAQTAGSVIISFTPSERPAAAADGPMNPFGI